MFLITASMKNSQHLITFLRSFSCFKFMKISENILSFFRFYSVFFGFILFNLLWNY